MIKGDSRSDTNSVGILEGPNNYSLPHRSLLLEFCFAHGGRSSVHGVNHKIFFSSFFVCRAWMFANGGER